MCFLNDPKVGIETVSFLFVSGDGSGVISARTVDRALLLTCSASPAVGY